MTNPAKAKAKTKATKPSGVWIVFEIVVLGDPQIHGYERRLVGVFDTRDLAETACSARGVTFEIANVEMDAVYRGRVVNWRTLRHL